jgi:hypothetical protein
MSFLYMKKRIIFLLIVLSFFPLLSQSQATIRVGGKAGVNWSRYNSDPVNFKTDARIGYQLGAFARIGDLVYFQPEFQWAWTATKLTDPNQATQPGDQTLDVHFFRVPVQLGFTPLENDAKTINWRFMTGPVFNFKFAANQNDFTSPLFDPTANYKPFNVAVRFGTGFDLWYFTVDMHYDLGVSDVFEVGDAKMRGFNLEAGVAIPLN